MAYNMKLKRFVLAIPKTELMTDEDVKTFDDEYNKKLVLIHALNAMGDLND